VRLPKQETSKTVKTKMKNTKIGNWSGLVAIVTAGVVLSGAPAFAADNGNIVIQGTVAPVNEIVVTPVSGYNTLDLTAGGTDVQVATVNEKNNDPDGYTVTLVSANAAETAQAFLAGADGDNAQVVNYSMKYGVAEAEAAVTLVAGSAVVTSTSAASIEAGAAKSLLITFAGSSWKNADTYSDTITLTIAAK
jgi:hypothetical protein